MVRHLGEKKVKKLKNKKVHVEKTLKQSVYAILADLKLLGKDIRKETLDTADVIFKSAKARLEKVGQKEARKPVTKVTPHITEKMKSAME